ncbi:ketoacyl-ACP synthase III family protein [Nocardiopsis quinghaiensis]|uniref:ketoacyl-ACP synthase III family protein n=1 Tax=Nocardiopsis quinghaiensis TaxID=464995 RepID=UPI001CC26B8A|nr:ketoacyl-ACP synthase III family protein [Nocardiopsis quinghaiensis]
MRTKDLFLSGLGVFVPDTVSTDTAVGEGLCPPELVKEGDMTGAAVANGLPAPEMALRAARAALDQSGGVSPEDLSLLLYADTWHQGPDGWFPQSYLQRCLGTGDALSLEIRQGCNAVFGGLELAAPLLAQCPGDSGSALIVASDNYGTPRMNRWTAGPSFFGDGASALVLTRAPGFARVLSVNSMTVAELEETHRFGEPLFPPAATTGAPVDFVTREEEFGAHLAEQGTESELWIRLHHKMLLAVSRSMSEAGVTYTDLTRAAFTSLGPDDMEHRWMELLAMPMSKSTWDYSRHIGHIGASDPFIGLHHLVTTGQVGPGDHVILGGIGSGVTVSCAVVEILDDAGTG